MNEEARLDPQQAPARGKAVSRDAPRRNWPARRQVLAAARTSANALGRAHLVEPTTSHTHPRADTHGNRPMTR